MQSTLSFGPQTKPLIHKAVISHSNRAHPGFVSAGTNDVRVKTSLDGTQFHDGPDKILVRLCVSQIKITLAKETISSAGMNNCL